MTNRVMYARLVSCTHGMTHKEEIMLRGEGMEVAKRISADKVKTVCKVGQGAECCRYLVCGSKGFECVKGTDTGKFLDSRVAKGTITAKGDNCEGA